MFLYKHRVRYYETDKMGVAHHSSFVLWFENARLELLRKARILYNEIEDKGYNLAVVEVNGRLLKPVFFDDIVLIYVSLEKFDGCYARFDYIVKNQKNEVVIKGFTKHIVVNKELKKAKLPESVIKKINSLISKSS